MMFRQGGTPGVNVGAPELCPRSRYDHRVNLTSLNLRRRGAAAAVSVLCSLSLCATAVAAPGTPAAGSAGSAEDALGVEA